MPCIRHTPAYYPTPEKNIAVSRVPHTGDHPSPTPPAPPPPAPAPAPPAPVPPGPAPKPTDQQRKTTGHV